MIRNVKTEGLWGHRVCVSPGTTPSWVSQGRPSLPPKDLLPGGYRAWSRPSATNSAFLRDTLPPSSRLTGHIMSVTQPSWTPACHPSPPAASTFWGCPAYRGPTTSAGMKPCPFPQQSHLSGVPANQALRGTPVHKPETFPAQFLIRNIGLWGGRGMTRGQVAYLLCARPEQTLGPKEASHRPLPSKSQGKNSGDADERLTIIGLCPALWPVSPHPHHPPITPRSSRRGNSHQHPPGSPVQKRKLAQAEPQGLPQGQCESPVPPPCESATGYSHRLPQAQLTCQTTLVITVDAWQKLAIITMCQTLG